MANTRSIQSPGVQVNEVDLSVRPVTPVGTNVMVAGYAAQGPTEEVFAVNNMSEFEMVYGKPTNPAERYFYQTARAVFNSDSRLLATRLSYGEGAGLGVGEDYTALFFPVFHFLLTLVMTVSILLEVKIPVVQHGEVLALDMYSVSQRW